MEVNGSVRSLGDEPVLLLLSDLSCALPETVSLDSARFLDSVNDDGTCLSITLRRENGARIPGWGHSYVVNEKFQGAGRRFTEEYGVAVFLQYK